MIIDGMIHFRPLFLSTGVLDALRRNYAQLSGEGVEKVFKKLYVFWKLVRVRSSRGPSNLLVRQKNVCTLRTAMVDFVLRWLTVVDLWLTLVEVFVGIAGHQRWVWDCVFSVDGAYLVTGQSVPLNSFFHSLISSLA